VRHRSRVRCSSERRRTTHSTGARIALLSSARLGWFRGCLRARLIRAFGVGGHRLLSVVLIKSVRLSENIAGLDSLLATDAEQLIEPDSQLASLSSLTLLLAGQFER